MDFDLSDEQRALADTFHRVLADGLPDSQIIARIDAGGFDRDLWRTVCRVEAGGMLVRESRGGLNLGLVSLAVVADAVGYRAAPLPVATNALAAWLIDEAGTDRQRERWLSPLMSGEAIAAFAFGEANDAWLPEDWTLGGDPLVGAKSNIEWGLQADVLIVGLKNEKLGLVEPSDAVVRSAVDSLDRTRPLADIRFKEAICELLPADRPTVARLIDAMLILLAADACGAAFTARDRAVEYAKNRRQFVQPIGQFQAVKHQLADMAVEAEPSRPLCWYAAHAWDVYPKRRRRIAALTKAHVTDGAVLVARAAIEIHGGIGYTWDYPIHVFLKRAIFDRAFLGGPRLHRERAAKLSGW